MVYSVVSADEIKRVLSRVRAADSTPLSTASRPIHSRAGFTATQRLTPPGVFLLARTPFAGRMAAFMRAFGGFFGDCQ